MKTFLDLTPCACGCGELIRPRWRAEYGQYSRYKYGHWQKSHPSSRRLFNAQQEEMIIAEYTKGTTQTALADRFNTSRKVIRGVLERANIPIRDISIARLRYKCDLHFFDSINNEAKAYWLGFIAADGSIMAKTPRYSMELMLKWDDREHIKAFRSAISGTQPIHKKIVNGKYPQARIAIRGRPFIESLVALGIGPRKSFTLTFPTIPNELNRHFIRGYFDGDGSIQRNKLNKQLHFQLLGTGSFLQSIQDILVVKCDLNSVKISQAKTGCKSQLLGYCGNTQVPRILDFLYHDATIYLERKAQVYFDNCC